MLSFVPLGMSLVPVVGHKEIEGQQPRRVCAKVRDGKWVIGDQPHRVEPNTPEAEGLCRMALRGDLAPADIDTAKAVGVQFRPLEYVSPAEGWRYQTTVPRRSAVKES